MLELSLSFRNHDADADAAASASQLANALWIQFALRLDRARALELLAALAELKQDYIVDVLLPAVLPVTTTATDTDI